MKKTLIIVALGIVLLFAACTRKSFVKKLTGGTWSLQRYLLSGRDLTRGLRDTSLNSYALTFTEDEQFLEFWNTLQYVPDTLIHADTLGFDTVNMVFNIDFDTIPFVDTIVTPFTNTGRWDLINSEDDLQLKDSADSRIRHFRILNLSSGSLILRSQNQSEEWYLIR